MTVLDALLGALLWWVHVVRVVVSVFGLLSLLVAGLLGYALWRSRPTGPAQ